MRIGEVWESGRAHIVGAAAGYQSELSGATRIVDVPVTTVDELRRAGEVSAPALVKIDVEGAELLALEGMKETLQVSRPVLVAELWGSENIGGAERLLRSLGYDVSVLSEWRGRVGGAEVEIRNILATG